MKTRRILLAAVTLALLLGLGLVVSAAQQPAPVPNTVPLVPVGTAFTYQGRLTDGGQPADGEYDLLFNLYVQADDAYPLSSCTVEDVPVSQGLFTVQIDFGTGRFRGERRYLEIGVRPGDSTGAFVFLTPRQPLLPTPYALALPGLWTQQNEVSPNLIGGYPANYVAEGLEGGTIGGGGSDGQPNQVTGHYGTVAGGAGNWAGAEDSDPDMSTYATIGGGGWNRAAGALSTIGGGWGNEVHGDLGTIGGGLWNIARGRYATIAGGGRSNPEDNTTGNRVSDDHGTVGGGGNNRAGNGDEDTANAAFATVAGGVGNTASGGESSIGGGRDNTAAGGGSSVGGGEANSADHAYTTIGGGTGNTASGGGATVAGGGGNTAAGFRATVAGGESNRAENAYSTVAGGSVNRASGDDAVVSGGYGNTASGVGTTVGGGEHNNALASQATIGGGEYVRASGTAATVAGGSYITATGSYAAVGGGQRNQANDDYATVSGGGGNVAGNDGATVAGGIHNEAAGFRSAVGGGLANSALASYTTIGGGFENVAEGLWSTVGGGEGNAASGDHATIAGGGRIDPLDPGTANRVSDHFGTVGGGGDNLAGSDDIDPENATFATVSGGSCNTASGPWATIGGGSQNEASGNKTTIGGGQLNAAAGGLSTIAGGANNVTKGGHSTIPGGHWAVASLYGQMAYASGRFSAGGDAQASLYVLRGVTDSAMATELFLDGGANSQRLTVALSRTVTFDILIVASSDDGQSAGYQVQGVIENIGGSTSLVGAPLITALGADDPLWRVGVQADEDNDALVIMVTGEEATNIRWVATVRTVEVSW